MLQLSSGSLTVIKYPCYIKNVQRHITPNYKKKEKNVGNMHTYVLSFTMVYYENIVIVLVPKFKKKVVFRNNKTRELVELSILTSRVTFPSVRKKS